MREKTALQIATHCRMAGECLDAAGVRTPARAPVVPVILNSLPPKMADMLPAQKAVTIPATGVPPHAIDNAMDNGMFTNATVTLDRKLMGTFSHDPSWKSAKESVRAINNKRATNSSNRFHL